MQTQATGDKRGRRGGAVEGGGADKRGRRGRVVEAGGGKEKCEAEAVAQGRTLNGIVQYPIAQ
jgi:hypothetical protein